MITQLKTELIYFETELEYKQYIYDKIMDGTISDVLIRGQRSSYPVNTFNKMIKHYGLTIEENKWFVLIKEVKCKSDYHIQYYKNKIRKNES